MRIPVFYFVLLVAAPTARAEWPDGGAGPLPAPNPAEVPDGGSARSTVAGEAEPRHETIVQAAPEPGEVAEGRAASVVRRGEMERRLPRSAPDALRYEPGVFVQQTGHGQGSAFVRGLTGQQTLLLFDGVRLNNSTYRQGPNQYLFTLDSQTIESIEVLRGGASTQHGSDALGGVVAASPIQPPSPGTSPPLRPSLSLRGATADREWGGRLQLAARGGEAGFVGGAGARRVGRLESAGPIFSPLDGMPPEVPRYAEDGRTQLGTGFDELTADGRFTYGLGPAGAASLAGYLYRQFNAPRTDLCPPPSARFDECLSYEEQFRTLVMLGWDGELGALAKEGRARLSWQRQHERRNHARPASFVSILGRDDVDSFGASARARTRRWAAAPWLTGHLLYGGDLYLDVLDSRAWIAFSDIEVTLERSRGQYLAGSTYLHGGAFIDLEAQAFERATLRLGARASYLRARAPGDAESGSTPIDRTWRPLVGHAGLEWAMADAVSLLANLDHSFRAPNLDDLSSRQQTGPGFQFENPSLQPELATTLEAGLRLRSRALSAEVFAFQTWLDRAVGKLPRATSACPPETLQCLSSWFRYQLVNAPERSEIRGMELSARARLPGDFSARATAAWAWGQGPNLAEPPSDPALPYEEQVPLSRIPPLNGTLELGWTHPLRLGAGGALRWAGLQDRLAIADRSDARIPLGGTPGFAVFDARFSYRRDERLLFALVVENLFDVPYRYHGSSLNGPGRGAVLTLSYSPR